MPPLTDSTARLAPQLHTRADPEDRAVRLSPALHVRASKKKGGVIEGYASTFGGTPDSYGDIIAPGAFKATLADHKAEGTKPIMLWAHSPSAVIGRWTEVREDGKGLYVEGQLNLDSSRGKDAFEHLSAGDVSGLSIGFYAAEGARKKQSDGTYLVTAVELVEISVVAVPANRSARVSSVKSLNSKNELIDLLRDGGLAKAAAARIAAGGWPALVDDGEAERATKAAALAAQIARATAQLKKA